MTILFANDGTLVLDFGGEPSQEGHVYAGLHKTLLYTVDLN